MCMHPRGGYGLVQIRFITTQHSTSTNAVRPCALTTPHAPLQKTRNPCTVSDLVKEDQTVKGKVHYQMILHNGDASSSLAVFLINPLIWKWGETFFFFFKHKQDVACHIKETSRTFHMQANKSDREIAASRFSPNLPSNSP